MAELAELTRKISDIYSYARYHDENISWKLDSLGLCVPSSIVEDIENMRLRLISYEVEASAKIQEIFEMEGLSIDVKEEAMNCIGKYKNYFKKLIGYYSKI
jgi:hypothetical protein